MEKSHLLLIVDFCEVLLIFFPILILGLELKIKNILIHILIQKAFKGTLSSSKITKSANSPFCKIKSVSVALPHSHIL